jgi:recombination associated protein RdgC
MTRFLRGGFIMWFRNLQLYRLGQSFELTPELLDERLHASAFRGCGRMELVASGWASPLGRVGQQLVHAANGYIMVCMRKEEKILPAGVIRQLLDDKVAEVEAAESREIYRREKLRMKEEIIVDLLPRALTRISNLFAYIDVRHGLLVVDSPSASKAETLVSLLRNTLGRFPATPVQVRHSTTDAMTRWLSGEALPQGFTPMDECLLRHPDPDGGVISCKHQDLGAAEVRNHIRNGKFAVRLAMQWRERLSFVLHDDLSIKRLRFEDIVRAAEQDVDDDPLARFDQDFSLLVLELAEFLPALLAALGGEAVADKPAAGNPVQAPSPGRPVVEAEPA